MLANPITTPRLVLRNLNADSVGDCYLNWLRDLRVNQYLEARFQEHTNGSLRSFINSVNDSSDSILFGIFLANSDRHIGNIKLGPINVKHHRTEIGILLGARDEWGKGYACEAIRAVSNFGFDQLGLRKILAGCYEKNVGSLKAFLKAGFVEQARLPEYWEVDGSLQAQIWLAMTPAESVSRPRRTTVSFGNVQSLIFIGGGPLMVATALYAKGIGYEVGAIFAPRHAAELMDDGRTAQSALHSSGINVVVVEDINEWSDLANVAGSGAGTLALCFGPAWIFSKEVIETFEAGMFNFNGIPIPRYLGGAHYTWQILNGDRKGGCFLQAITSQVDQGDILRYQYFDLPEKVRIPKDYFDANFEVGLLFLSRALDDMKSGIPFEQTAYEAFNANRLYFPRLFTKENAYIDWRWSGQEIERFCNGFDNPYQGAGTYWRSQEVRVHGVRFTTLDARFHPFTSGLVVRKRAEKVWIAVRDGLLEIVSLNDLTGESIIASIREGDRLITPEERLWRSVSYSAKFDSRGLAG